MRLPLPSAPRDVRQARRRQVGAVVAVLLVCALVVVGIRSVRGDEPAATDVPSEVATTTPTTADQSSPSGPRTSPSTSTASTPSTSHHSYRSTGRFDRAASTGPVRGRSGRLMTYRIEVERGAGVPVGDFAAAVDRTLRDRRGWTGEGQWRFRRLGSGRTDLIIRLATPDTVDKQCAAAGARTHGYASCRAGQYILLNLDRWLEGVPHIRDLSLYRHYLVNHEVGHGLGLGHEPSPGRGRRAPVMLQQTLDLDGCTPNAWPLRGRS